MKKYVTLSFIYAMVAIAFGVFYREFTKLMGFTGVTVLAAGHAHLLVLGTVVFLLVALFAIHTDVEKQKLFRPFMVVYNIGVPFAVIMMLVRGIAQVTGAALSSGLSAAISGLAGIAHTMITVALVFLFISLRKANAVNPHSAQ